MSSIRVLLPLLGLLAVAGCATKLPEHAELAVLPTEQFKTPVTSAEREFALVPHAEGLSPRQRDEVARLVADWRAIASGPVFIKIPTSADDATLLAAEKLEDYLRAYGLRPAQIERVGYDTTGPGNLRVGFLAITVDIPRCGVTQTSFTATGKNQVNGNFGCAVSANIAAMVANPADLLGPRPEDPADAGRRQSVLEKYRAGEITSSAKDENASGAVSDAIQ